MQATDWTMAQSRRGEAMKDNDGDRRSLVEQANELFPVFSAQAAASEAKGALTEPAIQALWDGGFFGMWIPACFRGMESWPTEALGTVEGPSYAAGAPGWGV